MRRERTSKRASEQTSERRARGAQARLHVQGNGRNMRNTDGGPPDAGRPPPRSGRRRHQLLRRAHRSQAREPGLMDPQVLARRVRTAHRSVDPADPEVRRAHPTPDLLWSDVGVSCLLSCSRPTARWPGPGPGVPFETSDVPRTHEPARDALPRPAQRRKPAPTRPNSRHPRPRQGRPGSWVLRAALMTHCPEREEKPT